MLARVSKTGTRWLLFCRHCTAYGRHLCLRFR